jgi:hypothetical protein
VLQRFTATSAVASRNPQLLAIAGFFYHNSLASSSRSSYSSGQKRWLQFLQGHGQVFTPPAKEVDLIMFISFLALERLAVSTIKKYISAVASLSKEMGFPIVTADFVQLATVFRGIKRQLGDKQRRKAPLRIHQLQQFKMKSIDEAKYLALCTIGLLGLFRLGELIHLQRRQVQVRYSHVEITLESSKTDPFRQGCVVYAFANGATLDPVQAAAFLLTEAKDQTPQGAFIQDLKGLGVPKRRIVHYIRNEMLEMGNEDDVAGHSLRIGGACLLSLQDYSYSKIDCTVDIS